MSLSDYKKEILGAIIGALLTAVLSLTIGIYNLNKTFELTQQKDLLFSLRTDITLLKNVERELDENLNLLLNQDYKILLETEPVKPPKIPFQNKEEEEFLKKIYEYFQYIHGRAYKITRAQYPSDKFVVDAWEPSGPTVSYIDFELTQLLNSFYRKLLRINTFIEGAHVISKGMLITEPQLNHTKNAIPSYNKMIGEITKNRIIQLKNMVAKEIIKLQEERRKIVY